MRKKNLTSRDPAVACGPRVLGQGFKAEPVFKVDFGPDREPVVAGEVLQLAAVVTVDPGWHINSDDPGDEFSMPTTVVWRVPEGWPEPLTVFPDGEQLEFDFSDVPIEVWEGRVVFVGRMTVPESASGSVRPRVEVTAQACNNTQCLPPVAVNAGVDLEIAPRRRAVETRSIRSSSMVPSRHDPPGCAR